MAGSQVRADEIMALKRERFGVGNKDLRGDPVAKLKCRIKDIA